MFATQILFPISVGIVTRWSPLHSLLFFPPDLSVFINSKFPFTRSPVSLSQYLPFYSNARFNFQSNLGLEKRWYRTLLCRKNGTELVGGIRNVVGSKDFCFSCFMFLPPPIQSFITLPTLVLLLVGYWHDRVGERKGIPPWNSFYPILRVLGDLFSRRKNNTWPAILL